MKEKIDFILQKILIMILTVMLLSVLWQVISRYFLNEPSSFTEELARYCLIWIGTLGAAYASGQNLHLAITIFPDSLTEIGKNKLNILLNVLIIFFSITVFCIGGSRLVYITNVLGQDSPALGVPLSVIYAIIPVSGVFIIAYKVLGIFKILGGTNAG